jgi:hypothetical protein
MESQHSLVAPENLLRVRSYPYRFSFDGRRRMKRYELIETLIPVLKEALVVCNIDIPSKELFSIKDQQNYFYMLGSMGLCASISLDLSLITNKTVVA